jgi:hypothetical protein
MRPPISTRMASAASSTAKSAASANVPTLPPNIARVSAGGYALHSGPSSLSDRRATRT